MTKDNISLFCEQTDAKGIKAICVYNWKKCEFLLEVSYKNIKYFHNWKANVVPVVCMDHKDEVIFIEKAEEFALRIEKEINI